jgi:hypothetical protein
VIVLWGSQRGLQPVARELGLGERGTALVGSETCIERADASLDGILFGLGGGDLQRGDERLQIRRGGIIRKRGACSRGSPASLARDQRET